MGTPQALLGRTIAGRFRVTGFIGEGAMAEVYRAEQDGEPRAVALKVMHSHLNADPTFIGRFRREAKAAAALTHPNTVRIVDFGVEGKLLYMAMELLEGKDLFDVLVVEKRFAEARAARLLIEVLDALAAAHDLGIVHRDLKPENIMVLPDPSRPGLDRVKVLDFGIAKILERDAKGGPPGVESPTAITRGALTTVGMVVGTPGYMSPEQCRGEAVDARSDVYSCGVLLYQLVTGRQPFTGETPIDIAIAHVRKPPTPPSEWMPGMHRGLEAIVLRALAKWPAERPPSAAAMRDELVRLLPELSTTRDRPRTPSTPVPGVGSGSDVHTAIREVPDLSTPAARLDAFARRQSSSGASEAPTAVLPAYDDGPRAQAPSAPALQPHPAAYAPPMAHAPPTPAAPVPRAPPGVMPRTLPLPAAYGPAPMGGGTLPIPTGPFESTMALPEAPPRPAPPAPPPPDAIASAVAAAVAAGPVAPPPGMVVAAPMPAAAPAKRRTAAWVLVPLAILLGMGVGALMFLMMR